jgi:hypothetical protein
MGKYGTNLEGFGGFEGGVNADKGAPLVSTSSDGETALLFGPAALREIQAGVANGDFAIPPDDSTATITSENPLPYWTFTDVNSAGAITCAVVADATAGSGNVLRWSVAASTPSGVSATLTRFVPVASTQNRAFVYVAEMTNKASANTSTITKRITQRYYKQDFTTTGNGESAAAIFSTTLDTLGRSVSSFDISAPADAAFLLITITILTNSTTPASVTTNDLFEVRMIRGEQTLLISEGTDPATYFPARIKQENGVLNIRAGNVSTQISGNLEVDSGGTPGKGNLQVDGTTTSTGLLTASAGATVTGTLTATTGSITGNLTVTGTTTSTGLLTASAGAAVTGNLSATGRMTAGNIKSGYVGVTVTANVVSSASVTSVGLVTSNATAGLADVSVVASQNSTRPDLLRAVTVGNNTFSGANMTGFTVYIFRTNSTDTGVWWTAVGR